MEIQMNLNKTAAAILIGAGLALTMTTTFAQMYNDPGPAGMTPSADNTVRHFPRSNTGSDPGTNLPYAATAGRAPYAQGEAQ
jgi:hypothetical protein